MNKKKRRLILLLAAILVLALTVSFAYFNDYKSYQRGVEAGTLFFNEPDTLFEALENYAPGDARDVTAGLSNGGTLAMEVRAKIELENTGSPITGPGGFAVYLADDVLSYSEATGYSLRAGATPVLTNEGTGYHTLGILDGSNEKVGTRPENVIFSEYIEGNSQNKALELFNTSEVAVDLSEYSIKLYMNGDTSPLYTIPLNGTLGSRQTFVIANPAADAAILAVANMTAGNLQHNCDDAIVLERNGIVADRIGRVGEDPGTYWGSGGVTTADHTLVRKAAVWKGDQNPDRPFDPADEWIAYPNNTFSYLKAHSVTFAADVWTGLSSAFKVVMLDNSDNSWQGATFALHVTFEGRQYRNAHDPLGPGGW